MKSVRCCDCGWLNRFKCEAPSPACVPDCELMRILSAEQCLVDRSCDAYEPLHTLGDGNEER